MAFTLHFAVILGGRAKEGECGIRQKGRSGILRRWGPFGWASYAKLTQFLMGDSEE